MIGITYLAVCRVDAVGRGCGKRVQDASVSGANCRSVATSDAPSFSLLDECARRAGLRSRSAAVQQAIRLLRYAGLEADYAVAWEEWDIAGEQTAWNEAAGDGLTDAPR